MKCPQAAHLAAQSQEGEGGAAVFSQRGLTLSEGFLLARASVEEQASRRDDKHRHGNPHRHRSERIGNRR